MKVVWVLLTTFFGPAWNSVKNKVNLEEFVKVCILAATTTTSAFSAMAFVYMHISEFVTDPNLITLISSIIGIITFIVDYWRRKNHGVPAKN